MAEHDRSSTSTTGQSGRPLGGGATSAGQHQQGEPGGSQEWNRRQRYGAFYSSATERARQRQGSVQSRRGTWGETERGGWNTGSSTGRTHGGGGYRPMGQGEGGAFGGGRGESAVRYAGGYRGNRGWEGRESGTEFGRSGEERYGGGEGAGGQHGGERRAWGGGENLTRRYDSEMGGGGDYGRHGTFGTEHRRGGGEYRSDEQQYGDEYGRGAYGQHEQYSGAHGEQYGGGDYARTGEETRRRTRWHREALTARDVMTSDPKTVTPESSLVDAARIMKSEDTGIVPVVDADRRLQGVITDRDVVIRALAEGKNPMEMRARDAMTDDVDAVTPDEDVRDVIEVMGQKQVRRVPVVDKDDRLLGIISMGDIANRADYDEDLQAALEDISSKRSFWSRLWS